MHPSIDQLLKVRDGEPVEAGVLQHLDICPPCAAELARLAGTRDSLRALAQWEPPDAWQAIAAEVQRGPVPARRTGFRRGMAAAIALLVGFAALLLFTARQDGSSQQPRLAAVEEPAGEWPVVPGGQSRADLVAQSRELEELLQALPQRRVERVATAATIDRLEQRIQWLDFQLSFTPDAGLSREQEERLWGERVQLMDSLVKVRYADAGRPSF